MGFWSALPDVARASLYAIDVLAPATSPRDQITSEACAATKTKAKGGRRIDTDPKKDKRIFDAWKTGRYPTYEALGRELQKTKHEVKTAIDRHRKRI